ncbi:MAG: hypothetical protein O7G88_03915, partial [bacterium]|nr:hypothetical protein [bacterium]
PSKHPIESHKVGRMRQNVHPGPDGRHAASFVGLITFAKTVYELIGLTLFLFLLKFIQMSKVQ